MIAPPNPVRRTAACLAFAIVAACSAHAQTPAQPAPAAGTPPPAAQPPGPPPGIEPPAPLIPVDLFALPDDLEVTLWAKSPQLRQPSNIDVDAQGRVWVTQAMNYRRHAGKEPDGDSVVVLEDSDGDGVADKSSTFIQEPALLAPLGIAVLDNQIIVSNAPDIIVYTDVDRDGKYNGAVDKRDVLLTGFYGRNHDHSLHSITFGPDGKYYFNHGNTAALFTDRSGKTFRIGSTYDPRSSGAVPTYNWKPIDISGAKSDDGHVYVGGFTARMNPDGTNVEVIGYNYRNSYEQTITSFGDVFQNDNDDPPASRTTFLQEYGNLGFTSRDGKRTWQADRRPGQITQVAEWRQDDPGIIPAGDVYGNGAPTGIVSYEGDELGEKWRGVLLSCETARNVIFGYFPKADGAGYKLERFDFFTSNKEGVFGGIDSQRGALKSEELKTWFRPSDVAVGPDGAIYVSDWFDPRTGGHQARDASFSGAIYRIAPKGKKLTTPKIDLNTTAGQITALRSPAVNVRYSGFTKLKAAGAASIAPVSELLKDKNPFIQARAVFLLAHLGPQGIAKVEEQLKAQDAQIRVAAFRALRRVNSDKVLAHAKTLATDSSPAVRREAALAMRDVPFAQSKDVLLAVAKGYDGKDRNYLEAWGTGATNKEADVYAALASSAPGADATKWPASYANLIWRLTPKGSESAFAARATAASLAEKDRVAAVTALGFIPTKEASAALLDIAQKGSGQAKTHATWWLLNYKDLRWKDFGIDAALKERGIYDPNTASVAPMIVPAPEPTKLPAPAEIAKLKGDAVKGAKTAEACLVCHRIGDKGTDYGPALTGFGKAQTSEVVITAIVNPSSEIAHGFEGMQINLADGGQVHGIVVSNSNPLIVTSMGGVTQMIPRSKIRGNPSSLGRSLMLSADQLGLSAQDVSDIAAYLKTQ